MNKIKHGQTAVICCGGRLPLQNTELRTKDYIRRPDVCQRMRKNDYYTELWMSPMRELSETESLAPERSALPQRMPQIR